MGKFFVMLAIVFISAVCIFMVYYVLSKDYKCKKYGHDIYWYPFVALNNNDRIGKCNRCGRTIRMDEHGKCIINQDING